MTKDELNKHFELAIEEMKKSVREDRPDGKIDPAVGAVIVLPNGEVHSAHRGELRNGNHAEYTLLERKLAATDCTGATMFVTLEPCAVGSRSLPKRACCEWIVGARVKKVYIGAQDPDPNVAGEGIDFLQKHGIEVDSFPANYRAEIIQYNKKFIEQAKTRTKKGKPAVSQHILKELISAENGTELLSDEALREYGKAVVPKEMGSVDWKEAVLKNLSAIELVRKETDGNYRITKDALIMFGERPSDIMPQVCINYLSFRDGKLKSTEVYEGPMALAVDDAMQRFERELPSKTSIELRRENDLIIPKRILREAIVNSIAHRDYSIEGAKVCVEIHEDKLIIKSPGLPQMPVTLAAMQKFEAPPFSRNPKLAYIFRKLGLMEESRLGMNEFSAMPLNYSLHRPQYEYNAPYLAMTFLYEPVSGVLDTLTSNETRALSVCRSASNISKQALLEAMDISDRTASRLLKNLVEKGVLSRDGTGKGAKYTLMIK